MMPSEGFLTQQNVNGTWKSLCTTHGLHAIMRAAWGMASPPCPATLTLFVATHETFAIANGATSVVHKPWYRANPSESTRAPNIKTRVEEGGMRHECPGRQTRHDRWCINPRMYGILTYVLSINIVVQH